MNRGGESSRPQMIVFGALVLILLQHLLLKDLAEFRRNRMRDIAIWVL